MSPVTQFLDAMRFLTRVPLPSTHQTSPNLSNAFLMFPLVGALIGSFTGSLLWAASSIGLPPFLSAIIAISGTIFLTGGLHEDGLGDVADGFGGGADTQRKLEIMRDSRMGTYGVLCLTLSIAARLGAFAALVQSFSPQSILYILIASAALSRGLMVGIVTILPPARKDGIAATLTPQPSISLITYALTLAITLGALLPIFSATSVAVIVATPVLATMLLAYISMRQIGGQTGDVAGATQQIAEITCLFAVITLAT